MKHNWEKSKSSKTKELEKLREKKVKERIHFLSCFEPKFETFPSLNIKSNEFDSEGN